MMEFFAFMYSDRPNAPASAFSGKIAENIKKDRLQSLLALQEGITREKNAGHGRSGPASPGRRPQSGHINGLRADMGYLTDTLDRTFFRQTISFILTVPDSLCTAAKNY
jgi:hypothetical protein